MSNAGEIGTGVPRSPGPTLRWRLAALLAVALIPLLALALYQAVVTAQADRQGKLEQALLLARALAVTVDEELEAVQQTLAVLVETEAVQSEDAPAVQTILRRLKPALPIYYANLFAINGQGLVYASAVPFPKGRSVSAADRSYFKQVMASGQPVVGDFQIGRIVGRPVVVMVYPVKDAAGKTTGMVGISLELLALEPIVARAELPPGTTVTLLDAAGTILFRHPDAGIWVGRGIDEHRLAQETPGSQEGMSQQPGADGIERLFGHAVLHTAPWHLLVGVPAAAALAQSQRGLQMNLATLVAVGGAALLMALRIAQGIEGPLRRLAEGVKAMGEGELGAPITAEDSYEIGLLARRVEDLRQGLVAARRQAEGRLQRLEALQQIDLAIVTTLDLEERLDILLEQVMARLAIDGASVRLVNYDTGELEVAAARGLGRREREALCLRVGEGVAGWVAQHGQLLAIPDVRDDPRLAHPELLEQDGLVSYLGVPLKTADRVTGVLSLATKQRREFAAEELDFFTTLGDQAAIAIQNARLHRETERLLDQAIQARQEALKAVEAEQARRCELGALYDVASHLAGASELDMMLPFLAQQVVETLRVTFCCIALLQDAPEPGLAIQACHPIRALPWDPGMDTVVPLKTLPFLAGVLEQGQPVLLEGQDASLSAVERHYLALDRVRSVLVVPICLEGGPLGLLILGEQRSAQRSPLDADKVRLARAMADQAASAIHRAILHEELETAYLETVLALSRAMNARDSYTAEHSQRLAAWAEATAQELGCHEAEVEAVRWGALLHDIGKIGVPDHILRKPGPLTDEEWETVRRHPKIGAEIVAPVSKLATVAPLIRHHQEWWDGSGYPGGLKGEEIPLGARILAVVDAYGAITDNRVYRQGRSHDQALDELKRNAGSQFDPRVVEAFVRHCEGWERANVERPGVTVSTMSHGARQGHQAATAPVTLSGARRSEGSPGPAGGDSSLRY